MSNPHNQKLQQIGAHIDRLEYSLNILLLEEPSPTTQENLTRQATITSAIADLSKATHDIMAVKNLGGEF